MSWNYRIIKKKEGYTELCEVYYDKKGNIEAYTEPLFVRENKKEIIGDLELMLEDCKKHPLLKEEELPFDETASR